MLRKIILGRVASPQDYSIYSFFDLKVFLRNYFLAPRQVFTEPFHAASIAAASSAELILSVKYCCIDTFPTVSWRPAG